MPTVQRRMYLLKAAAAAFSDSRDPFSDDWLIGHEVTSDECSILSEDIADAIEGALRTAKEARSLIRSFQKQGMR